MARVPCQALHPKPSPSLSGNCIRAQARRLQAMLEDVRAQRGSPASSDSARAGAGPGLLDEGVDGKPGAAGLAPAVSVGGTMRLPGAPPITMSALHSNQCPLVRSS